MHGHNQIQPTRQPLSITPHSGSIGQRLPSARQARRHHARQVRVDTLRPVPRPNETLRVRPRTMTPLSCEPIRGAAEARPEGQDAAIPSPPTAFGTVAEPIFVSEPFAWTLNSSTPPATPVCT